MNEDEALRLTNDGALQFAANILRTLATRDDEDSVVLLRAARRLDRFREERS